jgi:hypothetical protein
MTEWGRGSGQSVRAPARLPWIAFGILLGMAMAAGGLYAAWPGIDISQKQETTALGAEAEALRGRVAALQAELEQARAKSGAPDTGSSATQKRLQELAARIKDLTGRLEIAEKLNADLQAAQDKAAKGSDTGDNAALRAQIAEREDLLRKFDAELAAAEKKAAELEAERDALRDRVVEPGKLAELTRILEAANAEATRLTGTLAERDKALAQMDAEIARLAKFEAEAAELRKALAAKPGVAASPGEAAEKAARLQAESRLREAEGEIAALRSRVEQAGKAASAAAADLDFAKKAAGAAAAEDRKLLDGAKAQIAALNDRITALGAEIASLKSSGGSSIGSGKTPGAGTPAQGAREPRDPLRVAEAMARAKGLENLDENQRDRIGEGLIEGQCVGKVLTDVFGRPPAVAVRDLIKALDSDC